MRQQDGQVGDLTRELRNGTISADEAVARLEERGLTEKAVLRFSSWAYLIWIIPCFLPWLAGFWRHKAFDILAQLPRINFPSIIIYLALALFVAVIPLTAWGIYYNKKMGGCKSEDQTVFLLREGPYALI